MMHLCYIDGYRYLAIVLLYTYIGGYPCISHAGSKVKFEFYVYNVGETVWGFVTVLVYLKIKQ